MDLRLSEYFFGCFRKSRYKNVALKPRQVLILADTRLVFASVCSQFTVKLENIQFFVTCTDLWVQNASIACTIAYCSEPVFLSSKQR